MKHLKLNVFSKSIWLLFFYGILTTTKLTEVQPEQPRIIGGVECIYKDIPYIVQIINEDSICVGSLLSMEWILTAAHCIEQNSILGNKTFARTGFHYYNITPQIRYVKKGISYSKYNESVKRDPRYDIGLMLLHRAFDETDVVKPGRLPKPGFSYECYRATAAGTGATEIYANYSPKFTPSPNPDKLNKTLMCLNLEITSTKICKIVSGPVLWDNVDNSLICTVSKDKTGICFGDSGGPLSCKGVIIGVNSAVMKCAHPDLPSFAQGVESYLNFIAEVTNITYEDEITESFDTETESPDIEMLLTSQDTTKRSFYVENGNCQKRGIVRNLLVIGIFITLCIK